MDKNIGKYRILREIGKGGMGIVYKALDPGSDREVALKVLPSNLVSRTAVKRFHREAAALSRLDHPNIIQLHEFNASGGTHFFAMEYVQGKSISILLKKCGVFPPEKVVQIAGRVADSLSYAHRLGIVHRDVKPSNIMISRKGEVKLMDFGLVRIEGITMLTNTGNVVGTPEYMAPEQIDGGEPDARSDIYSLGISMYEMLTGTVPARGDTVYAVLRKQREETFPSVQDLNRRVSDELARVVHRMIEKDASRRYESAKALLQDLEKLLDRRTPEKEAYVPSDTEKIYACTIARDLLQGDGDETTARIHAGEIQTSGSPEREGEPSSGGRARGVRPWVLLLEVAAILLVLGVLGHRYRIPLLAHLGAETEGMGAEEETLRAYERYRRAEEHYKDGVAALRENDYTRAAQSVRQAITLRPGVARFLRALSQSHRGTGEVDQAIAALEESLEIEPDGPEAEEARRTLEALRSRETNLPEGGGS